MSRRSLGFRSKGGHRGESIAADAKPQIACRPEGNDIARLATVGRAGGEYVVTSLLSVGVNGPEYRLTKEGESFDRVLAQNRLIACA